MAEDIDDEIERLEEDLKKLESKDVSYGSPTSSQKDSLFKFFRDILTTKDTTRVGNLSADEVGSSEISVRGWKRIANYASMEGLNKVAEYFNSQSEIMTSSSMSKDGFWSKLTVTQIKKEQKVKEPKRENKRWFGKEKVGGE